MKIVLWSILGLFLVGDALFVLPIHFSTDKIATNYDISYKKDSVLLNKVFQDSSVHIKMNLPPLYQAIYNNSDSLAKMPDSAFFLLVNATVMHDLDFGSLSFPFFKVANFKGVVPFYSTIRVANIPGMDSTALVGNIIVNGKLSIQGIASPAYARQLVEKELMRGLKEEIKKIEEDINRPPVVDSVAPIVEEPKLPKRNSKNKRNNAPAYKQQTRYLIF